MRRPAVRPSFAPVVRRRILRCPALCRFCFRLSSLVARTGRLSLAVTPLSLVHCPDCPLFVLVVRCLLLSSAAQPSVAVVFGSRRLSPVPVVCLLLSHFCRWSIVRIARYLLQSFVVCYYPPLPSPPSLAFSHRLLFAACLSLLAICACRSVAVACLLTCCLLSALVVRGRFLSCVFDRKTKRSDKTCRKRGVLRCSWSVVRMKKGCLYVVDSPFYF